MLLLLLLLVLPQAFLAQNSPNRTLFHMTNETFNSTLESHSLVFVLFTRDNRASQQFLQIFSNLVAEQNQNSSFFPLIFFATIDLPHSIPFRTSHKLTQFPLLRLYNSKSNTSFDYNGGRSEDGVRKWLIRQFKETPSLVKEIKTIAELDAFIEKKNVVVGYFGPKYSQYYELFFNTAEKYPFYNFVYGFSIEIFDKLLGEKHPNGRIICFNSNDNEAYTYEEENLTKKSLKGFFEGCSTQSQFRLDFETAERLFKGKESFMILAINSTSNESLRALAVYKAAKIHIGSKILMTVFDSVHEDERIFGFLKHFYEITLEDVREMPFLLLIDRESKPGVTVRYKHFGGVYSKTVEKFYENWKNKAIEPIYKNLPKSLLDPDQGLIKTINYKMFNETVMSDEFDAFLMIYSIDCEACKRFKKVLRKIADKYKEIPSLRFFMINGIDNDVPDLDLQFVPSFYLYKRGKKGSPIYLNDHRDEEKITDFLRENLGWQWKQDEL